MRLFLTVVRGMLHKRTERVDLETLQPTTDELIAIVSAQLGIPERSFRILLQTQRKNLRIIRGWPLKHYGIENGYRLSIELLEEHINRRINLASVAEEQQIGSESQENDIISFTSTKSQSRQYLDTQLELLINEAKAGNLDKFCQILRQRPDDPDLGSEVLDYQTNLLLNELGVDGWSVLHCAVSGGHQGMVEFLLIKNVNVNQETIEGWTPLMLAIKSRKLQIFKLLLQHPNIEVNRATHQGTALYFAVDANLLTFTQILLAHKADESIVTKDGLRAIDACRSSQMQRLLSKQKELIGQEPFILQGQVCKQNIFYQMKPRYLVCNPFRNVLARYESIRQYPRNPTELIELTSIRQIKIVRPDTLPILTDKNFCFFEVYCPDRQIYGTKSHKVTELWVKTIFQSVGHCLLAKGRLKDIEVKNIVKVSLTDIIPKNITTSTNSSMERRSRGPSMFESLKFRNTESIVISESQPQANFKKKSPFEAQSSLTNSPDKNSDRNPDKLQQAFEEKMAELDRVSHAPLTQASSGVHSAGVISSIETKEISNVLTSRKGSMSQSTSGIVEEKAQFFSFEIKKLLGKGAFGKVFQAVKKTSGKKYALKALQKRILMLQRQMKYAISEVSILKQVDHPFIVKLYHSFQTARYLYMCLDHCACGDLSQFLAQKEKLSEDQARSIAAQLILAIEYLHERNILYRDMKPENILLHEDGYIRLADFGLSKTDCVGVSMSFCGSPAYLSPEMLSHRGVGKESDIYGIGCVLYEMLTGYPPFFIPDIDKLYKNIRQGKLNLEEYELSSEAKDLLKNLLKKQPTLRITLSQAKNHVFFKKIDFNALLAKQTWKLNFPKRLQNPTDEDSDCENQTFTDEDYVGDIKPNKVMRFSFHRPFS